MQFTEQQIEKRDFYHQVKEALKLRPETPEPKLLTFEKFEILVISKLSNGFETLFLPTTSEAMEVLYTGFAKTLSLSFSMIHIFELEGLMIDIKAIAKNPKAVLGGDEAGPLLESTERGSAEEEALYQDLFYTIYPEAKGWTSAMWAGWIILKTTTASFVPCYAFHAMQLSVLFTNNKITMIEFFSALKQFGIFPRDIGCELFTHIQPKELNNDKATTGIEILFKDITVQEREEPPKEE